MDFLRSIVNRSLLITIQGITFPNWVRLLARNRCLVHPFYWPRAVILTVTSLLNSLFAMVDAVVFRRRVRSADVQAPLIILGHFRSGTTHLHNLLSLDRSFAYPTLFETLNPKGFLSTELLFRLPTRLFLTRHRPQDNVAIDPTVPAEDELAIGISTLCSPYLAWVFPRNRDDYSRFLTLEDVTEVESKRWQTGLLHFLRKLTWKYRGRPLILKSPTHTARVARLLSLFPDARFIHIHRDPVEVFQSTRRLLTKLPPYFALQPTGQTAAELDEQIIRDYRRMYDAFFAQRSQIPPGQFCEVAYHDLVRDPVALLANIYRTLDLPGFERLQPELVRYLSRQGEFRKNTHPDLPAPLLARLAREWRRCFEAWGYDLPRADAPHFGQSPRTSHAHQTR